MAEKAWIKLSGEDQRFLEVNFLAQQKILLGLTSWLNALIKASNAEKTGDLNSCIRYLEEAAGSFNMIRSGQEIVTKEKKWTNWYRGEKKMNLINVEKSTKEVLEAAKKVSN